MVVGAVYRPPAASAAATDDLHDQLLHLHSLGRNMFVLGDMNLDLLCPEKPGVEYYKQMTHDIGLKQIVTQPTRPSQTERGSSGTLIDHILVPATEKTSIAIVIPNSCSDHDMIMTRISTKRRKLPRPVVTIRSTRSLSVDDLCFELMSADWSGVFDASGMNEKWAKWLSIWSPIIDKHMPIITKRPRHSPCPWLVNNAELRDSMRARDEARAAYRRDPSSQNQETFRDKRNTVKKDFRQARSSFFSNSVTDARGSAWKSLKQFFLSSRKNAAPVDTTNQQMADVLNNHFASCGPRVAAETETQRGGCHRRMCSVHI